MKCRKELHRWAGARRKCIYGADDAAAFRIIRQRRSVPHVDSGNQEECEIISGRRRGERGANK